MNRIVVGSDINELGILKDNVLIVDINKNVNLLINNNRFLKYVINVKDADVNILSILETDEEISFEINVDGGTLIFNYISYNGNDEYFKINLNKQDSSCYVYNSIIVEKKHVAKFDVMHNSSNTTSNIYNCGATKGLGSIKFSVSSKVPNGCKNCIVNQDSKIITFNDENDNEINPILLIDEYETEAKHAAFIGKFNDSQMFYLKSRGINEKDAMALLLKGYLIGIMSVSDDEKETLKKNINSDWR